MVPVVGRIYRRPEYNQPWWLTALAIFGSLLGLLYFAALAIQAGQVIWSGYSRIPYPRQLLTGRIAAMAMGLPWLSWSYWRWRERLFLAPAMRDLVTTPASPYQILKIALRINGSLGQLYALTFILFLFPLFRGEWLLVATASPASLWLLDWVIPLAFLSAAAAALIISGLNNAIGIALNILMSALGFGGVAARFRNVERVLMILKRPFFYGVLSIFGLMLMVELIGMVGVPLPGLSNSSLWDMGQSLNRQFEQPGTWLHAFMIHFPTVCWFDAMTNSMHGSALVFQTSINSCIAWLAFTAVISAVFLNYGLSMSVRAGWYGVPDAIPADASKPQPRRFDPDTVNGPLEGWLLARIGRMGRATLRLMAQNFEAGSIDVHLKRSILLAIPCVIVGYAAKTLVPDIVEVCMPLLSAGALGAEREIVGFWSAGMVVVFAAMYRLHLWGTWRAAGAMLSYSTPGQTVWQLEGWHLRRAPIVVTRGDARHPACEVYAVGLKDAVLLPTFYTIAWLFPVIAIGAGEALALGLPPPIIGWTFIILIPALAQLYYLGILISMISYWMDYSRSRWLVFFKGLAFGLSFGTLIAALAVLIVFLCAKTLENNRPFVAWLGCMNITVVFDIALYSFFRWVYLRRRFDAERQQPRTFA